MIPRCRINVGKQHTTYIFLLLLTHILFAFFCQVCASIQRARTRGVGVSNAGWEASGLDLKFIEVDDEKPHDWSVPCDRKGREFKAYFHGFLLRN